MSECMCELRTIEKNLHMYLLLPASQIKGPKSLSNWPKIFLSSSHSIERIAETVSHKLDNIHKHYGQGNQKSAREVHTNFYQQ